MTPADENGGELLRVRDVRRHYPVRRRPWDRTQLLRAVDGVSLQVAPGETVAVVGESGSGKTTLGRLVLNLERPDGGEVLFRGADVHAMAGDELRAHQRRVQAVFQNPWSSLNPRMKIGASLSEPLELSGSMAREERRRRVADILVRVGLDPAALGRYPNQFSGGQRQRIALARALVTEPRLIVLDEPVSALDVSIRAQIMNLLKDMQQERGVAYLMIAHDLATVRYLAHHVVVMYLGRVVETGSTQEIFSRSRHPYTRALVSAAIPDPHDPAAGLVLEGEIPSPISPPTGCPFHTRCWLYERLGRPLRCTEQRPEAEAVTDTHAAACHFGDELLDDPAGVVGRVEIGSLEPDDDVATASS